MHVNARSGRNLPTASDASIEWLIWGYTTFSITPKTSCIVCYLPHSFTHWVYPSIAYLINSLPYLHHHGFKNHVWLLVQSFFRLLVNRISIKYITHWLYSQHTNPYHNLEKKNMNTYSYDYLTMMSPFWFGCSGLPCYVGYYQSQYYPYSISNISYNMVLCLCYSYILNISLLISHLHYISSS